MNSRIAAIGLAAALFALTACGAPIDGKPSANVNAGGGSESPTSTGTASPTPSATSRTSSPAALDDTDPCGLVTAEDVERAVGALDGEPRRNDLGSARSCEYELSARLLVIDIRTNVGLDGVNASGPVTDLTMGGHQVKTWITSGGSCFFALGVTSSSRVDVASQPKRGEDPCGLAKRLAELVEPRLP